MLEPRSVGQPLVRIRSLIDTGTPSRSPVGSPRCPARLAFGGRAQGVFGRDDAEGVEDGIEPVDAGQDRPRRLDRRGLAAAIEVEELVGTAVGEIGGVAHRGPRIPGRRGPHPVIVIPGAAASQRRRRGRSGCGTTDAPRPGEQFHDRPRDTAPHRRRLPSRSPQAVRQVRPRRDRPARLPRRRRPVRGRRGHRRRPARGAEPELRRRPAGAQDRRADQGRDGRLPVAPGLRHRCAATWCGRQRAAAGARPPACRWCWWCTRTAASIRTSRTSPAGSRSTTSSPSRPTRCSRSAAIRATRTRRASCSASSTRPRRARTSSPRPGT